MFKFFINITGRSDRLSPLTGGKLLGALLASILILLGNTPAWASSTLGKPQEISYPVFPPAPARQTQAEVDAKSAGCMSCHTTTDEPSMHASPGVKLGCTDCHGGDASAVRKASFAERGSEY